MQWNPKIFTRRGLAELKLLGLALIAISLWACSEPPLQKLEGYAQGTTYHISYWSAEQPVDANAIKTAIENEFAAIDLLLSNYRPDSVIEKFNSLETSASQTVGEDIVKLVRIAENVNQLSHGCYDLTIKPLFELWGFKGESLTIPPDPVILNTLKKIGMSKLEVANETSLRKRQLDIKVDLSSIAQGYSVGRISRVLINKGIKNYLIEIGGELQTAGSKPDLKPWRIAVEKPIPGAQSLHKIISLPTETPSSVMTSGTYRHYFDADGKRYSHILDARTGKPISHNLVSVTVVHPDPSIADAWSTALLCLGEPEGRAIANAEHIPALFITQQGDQLIESKSDPLTTSTTIIFH